MNWQSIWGAFTSRVSQPFKENLDMKTVSSGPDVEAGTLKRPSTWQDFEQPRYSRRETILTMIGVLLVMLLASLDQTIVSTAMPRVIADLQGFDRYTWVSTAYLLTSTVMVPIYGKLSDMFGRKPIFLFGIVVFLIGSALSGASQSMNELIAFRALQGIGAGALMPIAIAVVGDLFTPRERGKWQGVTGAVWGFSAIVGPTLGGWITENTSWRWVFYVNLPIGIIAMLVLIFLMPALRGVEKKVSIDYTGAAMLIAGTVALLLGFTWAGTQYDWLSPQIIGLFAGAVIVLTAFVIYEALLERRGGQPIIEPSLFKNSIFSVSSIVGSVVSGQLVSRLGKYKWIAILGMIISVAGGVLLVRLGVNSTNNDVLLAMLVMGLGMGFGMSLYTLVVQNALPRKIGQATSALVFFRSIGGTIGLAAMGSAMTSAYLPTFTNALPAAVKQLPTKALAAFNNPQVLLSADTKAQLQSAFAAYGPQGTAIFNSILAAVKMGLAQGIHNVFVLSLGIMIAGLVAVLFLKEIPLRGGSSRKTETAESVEDAAPGMAENVPAML